MGNLKKNVKKGIVLALSAVMALGLTPSVLNGSQKVQAADTEEQAPTAMLGFATKDELRAGDSSQRLKIYLGTNSKGNYQSWYVLGKDDGVNGDNTALFATDIMMSKNAIYGEYKFNSSNEEKQYQSSYGTYSDGTVPDKVNSDHWGASDVRKELQNLVTKLFFTAEQAQLNETPISTLDTKQKKDYTTKDILYLPDLGYMGDVFHVGSKNDKTIGLETSSETVWARTAGTYVGSAIAGYPSEGKGYSVNVERMLSLQPATNLKLDQVLFAAYGFFTSGMTTTMNYYQEGTSYYLRYDGSSKGLGTLTYNSVTGQVDVSQLTTNALYICVQGTEAETGTIGYARAFRNQGNMDISKFDLTKPVKIWAEMKDSDGLIYATNPDDTVDTAVTYNIEQGNGGTWTENTDTTYVIKGSGAKDAFTGVKVNGTLVDAANYDVAEGSTVLTFKEAYLKSLDEGTYNVEMLWNDGHALATFNVKKDNSSAGGGESGGGSENPGGGESGGNTGNTENPYEKPEVVTPSGDTVTKGETTDYPVVKPDDDKKLPTVDKVTVDGKELEKDKDYTVDGDGNVTIKKDYIDSLPAGDHTIEIAGKDANGQDDTIKKDLTVANPANGGETWTPASDKDYVVTPDNKLTDVSGVKINGNWIDPKDYTIASDGTLTLKKDYLATLPNGDYTIEIIGKDANGNDAVAKASFSVAGSSVTKDPVVTPTNPTTDQTGTTTPAAKTPTQTASPKTGENFGSPLMLVWAGSLMVACTMLASMLADSIKNRRRR